MNANVEDRGIKGDCTPLMEAASAGHVDIVSLLIAHGADVNAQSTSGKINIAHAYLSCVSFILHNTLRSMTRLISLISVSEHQRSYVILFSNLK